MSAFAAETVSLLERADGRRRLRVALRGSARALWAGLAVAIVVVVAARLAGARQAMLVGPSVAVVAAVLGGAIGLPARDLKRTAAELDRRCGLEATLVTGLEVGRDAAGGNALARAALRQADRAAGGLHAEAVPVDLPPGARYLAVPAAVLAGLLLLPSTAGTARGPRGLFPAAGPAAANGATEWTDVAAETTENGFTSGPRPGREDVVRAVRKDIEEARRQRDAAEALASRHDPGRGAARSARAEAGAREPSVATGDAEGRADAGGPDLGGAAAGGPIDPREEAAITKRFPGYAEVIQRYFESLTRD